MDALQLGREVTINWFEELVTSATWDTMAPSPAYMKFVRDLNKWKERYLSPLFLEVSKMSPSHEVHFDICAKPFVILETYVREAYTELCERQTDALLGFTTGSGFVVEQEEIKRRLPGNMFAMLNEEDAASWTSDQVTICLTVGGTPFRFSATNRLSFISAEALPAGVVAVPSDRPKLSTIDIQRFLYGVRNVLNAHGIAEDCLVTGCLPYDVRARIRLSLEYQFLHPQTVPVWPDALPLTKNPCKLWAADMMFLLDTMEARLKDSTQRTVTTLPPEVMRDFLSTLRDGSTPTQASYAVRMWMPRMVRSLGCILNMSLLKSYPTLFSRPEDSFVEN